MTSGSDAQSLVSRSLLLCLSHLHHPSIMTKKDVHASPAKTSSTTTVVTSTENGAVQNKLSAKQPPAKSPTKTTTSTTTRRLSLFALLMVAWFMMSGWIHVVLEGVWLANHQHVPSAVDFFASLSNFRTSSHNLKSDPCNRRADIDISWWWSMGGRYSKGISAQREEPGVVRRHQDRLDASGARLVEGVLVQRHALR